MKPHLRKISNGWWCCTNQLFTTLAPTWREAYRDWEQWVYRAMWN